MTKKTINQNSIYTQELIKTIEPDFSFSNKPINRFKIIGSDGNKNNKLADLKGRINSIEDCNLRKNSKNLVLGDGNIHSPIMLIGENPGSEEDDLGKVFQGDVGSLLNKMLLAINIQRDKIYITYALNFRAPEDKKPTSQEIKRYSNFIKEHISIIDPKIIVLMGSSAMEAITGLNGKISEERGKWKEVILRNKTYPLMVTFSPSYLMRFPDKKKYSWEDLKKIKQKIQDLNIEI